MGGLLIRNDNQVFVSYKWLRENGVSEKTYSKWRRNGKTTIIEDNGTLYVDVSTIPKQTRDDLPSLEILRLRFKVNEQDVLVNKISTDIEYSYHYEFQQHLPRYSKYQLSADTITHFARLHAVWEKLFAIKQPRKWNRAAQRAFIKLFPGTRETYNSFCNAIRDVKKFGIEPVVVDGRKFKEKGFSYCDRVVYWIKYYFSNGKSNSKKKSYELAMAKCKEENILRLPKLRCATKFMKDEEDSNIDILRARRGASEANKQMPFVTLKDAMYPLSQVQIDGFTLPFYYKENGKLKKLIVVVVLDNHSKKILGFAFGESENSMVIFDALENAFRKTKMLPGEILSDNHTFHKTGEAAHFKQQLNNMGVIWTVDSNPQRKAKIERFFGVLNNGFLKSIPGNTGEGVLTRNKHGRPSQEYIDDSMKPENIHTPETIKVNAMQAMKKYNATTLKKYGKSPNELYEQTEKKHAIPLSLNDRMKLFTKATRLKVRRGQITITKSGVQHEFQLNAELMHQWNNKQVIVRYVDLNEGIYLYDSDKDLPIGDVKPKPLIQGAIVEQDESDREKLLKNKGRIKGFITKARKENEALNNKDAVYDMNPRKTSKDDIQKLQQDADFRREAEEHGVNMNYYAEPPWDEDKHTAPSLKPKSRLKNSSPFDTKDDYELSIINVSYFDDK